VIVQGREVQQDALLDDVLLFPPGTDLHEHPLVKDACLILQVRSCSCSADEAVMLEGTPPHLFLVLLIFPGLVFGSDTDYVRLFIPPRLLCCNLGI
jgi:hypothetical protein